MTHPTSQLRAAESLALREPEAEPRRNGRWSRAARDAEEFDAPRFSHSKPPMVLNTPSPEGIAFGREIARLCDGELDGKQDDRCETCAFRLGTYPNGCVPTLANAMKCVAEQEPFYCHEHERPCAGWVAMRFKEKVTLPFDFVDGIFTGLEKDLPSLTSEPQPKDRKK